VKMAAEIGADCEDSDEFCLMKGGIKWSRKEVAGRIRDADA